MYTDLRFLESCIKATGDLRLLTGKSSLHTEADFLAWTKGEDRLPITDDINLTPRIPYELILEHSEAFRRGHNGMKLGLLRAQEQWTYSIQASVSACSIPDLEILIYTCKILLDYFLFGKPVCSTDHVNMDRLNLVKKRWESVKHFQISERIWKLLPNLNRDITRLYWGVSYHRNSLRKAQNNIHHYDETVFGVQDMNRIKTLPIRCFRSGRSLHAIISTLQLFHKSVTRTIQGGATESYRRKTIEAESSCSGYVGSDKLEISEQIEAIQDLIYLHPEEKKDLQEIGVLDTRHWYPEHETLQLCFWVHKYFDLEEDRSVRTVKKIRERFDALQERLLVEMRNFESELPRLDSACSDLRETILSLKVHSE
jgi:hypothetical protein